MTETKTNYLTALSAEQHSRITNRAQQLASVLAGAAALVRLVAAEQHQMALEVGEAYAGADDAYNAAMGYLFADWYEVAKTITDDLDDCGSAAARADDVATVAMPAWLNLDVFGITDGDIIETSKLGAALEALVPVAYELTLRMADVRAKVSDSVHDEHGVDLFVATNKVTGYDRVHDSASVIGGLIGSIEYDDMSVNLTPWQRERFGLPASEGADN